MAEDHGQSPAERRFLIRTDMREQNSRVVSLLSGYPDVRL
jgi:hypothetical protein